ncbi:hypothetical protein HHL17_25925 [Chitinophaga sp. G-6-1-13]|uniref:Uncharacterized protein n=1 Tax=Chitinophaga fulva TaxID=2728842 RepID=A0A848GU37_9BACT|nr:hypothetical protein [Chitinophaga fulva]NML40662.1 hypothetical protein [Chitinophaga fulva]
MDKEKDVTGQPDPPFSKDDLLGAEGESDFTEEQPGQDTTTDEKPQENSPESEPKKKP